jgi:tetratricopeptide (TPR) repeat protein
MFSQTSYHISLLICLGRAYRLDSQREKAIATHLQAEQIAQETGHPASLGEIQHDLLEDYLFARLYAAAKQHGQRALTILAETEASPTLLANCYKMLGTVCYETEAFQEAEKYFAEAITRWRQMDDPVHLARTLNDLARLWLTLGRYDEAQDGLSEAAELLADTINELDKCMIYINLGSVLAAQQQWALAETAFYQANSRYLRQSADLPRRARVNNNLGYVLFKQEKPEVAEEYLQQALQLWQEMGDDLEYANSLSILADSWLARQQPHIALPMYEALLLKLAPYPQNGLARRLQEEYSVVYAQLREKAQAKQPA